MNTATTLPDASVLHVNQAGAFLVLTFNQPRMRNPLGPEVVQALSEALSKAQDDASCRAIVIRGAGEVFSAGGNLGNLQERLAASPAPDGSDPIATRNRPFGTFLARLARFPKPVVVAVHGAAMGGGAGLVCAADVAIACAGTRFSFTEASLGLVPAQILPTVVARIGAAKARRLMLTAERIDADEALRLGLVDAVAPDMQALRELLGEVLDRIGRCAPQALARTKRLALRCASGEPDTEQGLERLLDDAAADFAAQMRSDGAQGVQAARERLDPPWRVRFDRAAVAQW